METEMKPGLIFKQIAKVMADVGPIAKEQTNVQQGFKFRGVDDIYNALHSVLATHGVFTVPKILGRTRSEVVNSKGTKGQHIITNFSFRFYAEDGSFVDAETDGEAIDWGGDKASNKAASIAHKYALLQVFCIPTKEEKDPDEHSHNDLMPTNSNRFKPSGALSGPVHINVPTDKPNAFKAISDSQRKLAFAMARQIGWSDEETKKYWIEWSGKESSKDWTPENFKAVIDGMRQTIETLSGNSGKTISQSAPDVK